MITANSTLAVHAGEEQSSRRASAAEQRWSATNEDFEAESLSNLIIANDWLRAGDIVYAGTLKSINARDLVTADDVIAIITQRAKAVGGEAATEYPSVTDLEKRILGGALAGWIGLCCPPTFLCVESVSKHTLTDIDLDAAAREVIGGAQ